MNILFRLSRSPVLALAAASLVAAPGAGGMNEPEAAALLRDAAAAEARFDSRTALDLLLRLEPTRPDDAALLQRISRQYSDLTVDAADTAEKKRLATQALAYAQRAAELAPHDAVNLLSVAISYGKLGLYSDTRTRIEYSRFVRDYAERALAVNPDYDYAHHVLGRWHYEVARLGAATRLIVRLIYGGLPPASTAEAVRHLERAVALSPTLVSHRVELGLALIANDQTDAGRSTLENALTLPTREKYDDEARRRARKALAELAGRSAP